MTKKQLMKIGNPGVGKSLLSEKILAKMAAKTAKALEIPIDDFKKVLSDISDEFDKFDEFINSGEMKRRLDKTAAQIEQKKKG